MDSRRRISPDFSLEMSAWDSGYDLVAGIDEAGRGPLAGPVVAASVILPKDLCIIGLNDSKKLTAKNRNTLHEIILNHAVAVGIKTVGNEVIDEINILNATKLAMIEAVKKMPIRPDFLLIDGNFRILVDIDQEPITQGDSKSMSIAAASIVAKVTRDVLVEGMHQEFPQYNWIKNKGYGTLEHRNALKEYGSSKYHRKSFKGVPHETIRAGSNEAYKRD